MQKIKKSIPESERPSSSGFQDNMYIFSVFMHSNITHTDSLCL